MVYIRCSLRKGRAGVNGVDGFEHRLELRASAELQLFKTAYAEIRKVWGDEIFSEAIRELDFETRGPVLKMLEADPSHLLQLTQRRMSAPGKRREVARLISALMPSTDYFRTPHTLPWK